MDDSQKCNSPLPALEIKQCLVFQSKVYLALCELTVSILRSQREDSEGFSAS